MPDWGRCFRASGVLAAYEDILNRSMACMNPQEALEAPNPKFEMLQIVDIIPQRLRGDYAESAGKV